MAHEIKNPLTPIRLTLDRLAEKVTAGAGVDAGTLSGSLDRMNEQVDALERLVDQFRSFSRDADVHCVPIGLRAAIEAVGAAMAGRAATHVTGDAVVHADPHLLNQVLLNLWKNAVEAGADRIDVTAQSSADAVTVVVRDNGCGIPAGKVEQVWLPYVTLKKGGTGLGLPVVRKLVELMGGQVHLTSRTGGPERGVCVTMRLLSGKGHGPGGTCEY